MLPAITLLLLFQLIGEVLARGLSLPLPGPVVGMLLLFGVLLRRGAIPDALERSAHGLLSHLSLMFVPAGVGIMIHAARLQTELWPILFALVASTIATLVISALAFQFLLRWRGIEE